MARTEFATDDPLAVKVYSAKVQKALPKASWFMSSGFVGEDPKTSVIVKHTDLKGKYGDQITYGIRQQIRGYTAAGDNQLEPHIKKLTYLDDKIALNQQRSGVNSGGRMSNKRVPYKVMEDSKDAQVDYWGVHLDEEFIGKLSGALGVGEWETINPNASGFDVDGAIDCDGNALRAPSANRHVINSADGTLATMTNAHKMTLDVIDQALKLGTRIQANATTRRKMAPLIIGGKKCWIFLMDLIHAFDLKAATGGRWYDIERARLQGGLKDSALVQNSLGVYESAAGRVILYSHEGMVKFNNGGAGGNLKYARALLMGQSAGVLAPGEEMGDNGLFAKWHMQDANHGNEVVISTGLIYGVQKCAYRTQQGAADSSREDYGVVACDVYAEW